MKHFCKLLAALAAALASASSQAALWEFSYTFKSGQVVSGSFEGDKHGQYVEDISNISANLDGTPFRGTYIDIWNMSPPPQREDPSGEFVVHPGRISPILALNNFRIIDTPGPGIFVNDANNLFEIINTGGNNRHVRAATGFESNQFQNAFDSRPNQSRWSLVQVVPEPATAALVALGLMGVGFSRRRQ